MTLQWLLAGLAVVLLLFPADRLLSSRVELRTFDCFMSLENSPRFRPWWWVPALWIDPMRGYLGTRLLQRALKIDVSDWHKVSVPLYAVVVVLVTIAVLIQTFTKRGDHTSLLAPIGFVAGVAASLVPWVVAGIGIVAALVGLFAFRQFRAYFACGLLAVIFIGFVLGAHMVWVILAACTFALPMITEFLTGRTLEVPTRNSSGPALLRTTP